MKADHECMLIPNHNDLLSPLPTPSSLDDPYSDLQKEPSGKNNIGDNHLASSQPEQSDYLHCLHDSFETASVESGNSQYLYPVYTKNIVSNSVSLAVAQDSDYESPKYLQHIFVFKTTSRTELPRTELDDKDQ